MPEFYVFDRLTLAQIINTLKMLELHRFEDYDRLVSVVALMEQTMLHQKQDKKTDAETAYSSADNANQDVIVAARNAVAEEKRRSNGGG